MLSRAKRFEAPPGTGTVHFDMASNDEARIVSECRRDSCLQGTDRVCTCIYLSIYIYIDIFIYIYISIYTHTWNPHDPCFGLKRLCFGGLAFKHRGHLGCRDIYIYIYICIHVCMWICKYYDYIQWIPSTVYIHMSHTLYSVLYLIFLICLCWHVDEDTGTIQRGIQHFLKWKYLYLYIYIII